MAILQIYNTKMFNFIAFRKIGVALKYGDYYIADVHGSKFQDDLSNAFYFFPTFDENFPLFDYSIQI